MVECCGAGLDQVFRALASEPRREILRRVAHGRCTVTELAEHFDITLAAVSKHVRVLDEVGLLSTQQEGRLLWRRLNPEPLEAARSSIKELTDFWSGQLDNLEQLLTTPPVGGGRRSKRKRAR
jgi:DNA-binding transcriptional ArsR family regulator